LRPKAEIRCSRRSDEDGLKPGWINVEIIFARSLRARVIFSLLHHAAL
jgi:hypothetical protein